MRKLLSLLAILFFSCKGSQTSSEKLSIEKGNVDKVQHSIFQELIDTSNLIGSILIYDLQNDVYHSNNFDWAEKGHLPASTFKITNTLIGLETGVIANDSMVFEWDGQDRWSSAWETDLLLRDAFHLSCVSCYQEVARDIGVERMKDYTSKFNYGNIVLDETSIDNFWLVGSSRISQMEQISFLKRLYQSKLPISERTDQIMKNLMVIKNNNHYKLSGKTGLSNENDHYNGWFVGFLERDEQTLFFATNIEPKDQQIRSGFIIKRKEITILALNSLGYF